MENLSSPFLVLQKIIRKMKIIDNLPVWEHEDFVMRNPMVDCKPGNMVIGWMIVDKDTDVPESFQISFTKDELTNYCKILILLNQKKNYTYILKKSFHQL